MPRPTLTRVVTALRRQHGAVRPPPPRSAFQWILWEMCSYLSTPEKRRAAFDLLKKSVGLTANDIVAAPQSALFAVAMHGRMAELFGGRLREIAEIALGEFDGELDDALSPDIAKAKRQLQKFPGIAVPGAERILLAIGRLRALAVESNGLRVLKRVGFGPGTYKTWIAEYRAVLDDTPIGRATNKQLFDASLLLQQHGRTICKTSKPRCEECALLTMCAFAQQS